MTWIFIWQHWGVTRDTRAETQRENFPWLHKGAYWWMFSMVTQNGQNDLQSLWRDEQNKRLSAVGLQWVLDVLGREETGVCIWHKVIRKGQDILDDSQAFNTPGGNDCVTFNSNGQRACREVTTWRKRMSELSRMSLRRWIGVWVKMSGVVFSMEYMWKVGLVHFRK